jgi:hypothetical protein
MRISKYIQKALVIFLLFLLFALMPTGMISAQQTIGFGIHADPAICWFSSDIDAVKNDGSRPGFNFGLTYNKYFASNYSFSTGISLVRAGGRLVGQDTTELELKKLTTVLPGESVVYKIQYLSIPVGLKLQTNQIGYITFFADLGLDPKVVIGGKADVPSLDISGENAINELRVFNLSFHFTGGFEYSLGGTTAMVLGLNFDNNFFDITKDNGDQPDDKVSHKILSFRIGVNF